MATVRRIITALWIACVACTAVAQTPRPPPPTFPAERAGALLKHASYYAFLAEACNFDNAPAAAARDLIKVVGPNYSAQQQLLEVFNKRKREYAEGSNIASRFKRCQIDSGKTKAEITDIATSIRDLLENARSESENYKAALASWEQTERTRREEEQRRAEEARLAQQRADAERQAAADQQRQERVRGRAMALAEELGKVIVFRAYDGGQSIGTKLVSFDYTDSTYRLKVEIKWNGRMSGESGYGADGLITVIEDSATEWTFGKNVKWNPTWQSSKLDEWISNRGLLRLLR